MISRATHGKNGNKLKYASRIVLVTDGQGQMDSDELGPIVSKLKDEEIELTIL